MPKKKSAPKKRAGYHQERQGLFGTRSVRNIPGREYPNMLYGRGAMGIPAQAAPPAPPIPQGGIPGVGLENLLRGFQLYQQQQPQYQGQPVPQQPQYQVPPIPPLYPRAPQNIAPFQPANYPESVPSGGGMLPDYMQNVDLENLPLEIGGIFGQRPGERRPGRTARATYRPVSHADYPRRFPNVHFMQGSRRGPGGGGPGGGGPGGRGNQPNLPDQPNQPNPNQFLFEQEIDPNGTFRRMRMHTYTPEQQQLLDAITGIVGGQGAQANIPQGATPEQQAALQQQADIRGGILGRLGAMPGFGDIERQARRGFEEQTLPSLAERFGQVGPGAERSGAFTQAMSQAGAGLEEQLAGLRAQYNQQAQQQREQQLYNLLNVGLQPRFNIATAPVFGQQGATPGQHTVTGGQPAPRLNPYGYEIHPYRQERSSRRQGIRDFLATVSPLGMLIRGLRSDKNRF